MKIYFTDQQQYLEQRLEELKLVNVMEYDTTLLKEKTTSIQLETKQPFNELNLNFLFNYHIFPENILRFKTEWQSADRSMKTGDTIVQQIYLPPTHFGSLKLIFGVRIKAIINEPTRKGFSYETLEGHVEKGISTFIIEETAEGLFFKIHTYSVPGNFLSRLTAFFSIPYQRFCTRKALENVKRQVES
ncbi:MAG: hypothetical protein A3D31_13775 [Candidatus Fluviicola riflensis]|nr:MAG: hypothetical protein CHH17_18210 [Candidatus Fluviicola riflensis]OGS78046.1 MAG: hypothetical protein A3D31_13775 [Candidatus Fluviicola riflensis]OGS85111.1 MAG: hypothetical protein A2724_10710 [Fluviicola sp. RIFCSPHIGHO2_01_FULL_43_53]OGS89383.1 MAG: hypothetical protein A3E30_05015 [Fluviicola sp. RIFCSPHIGHO2_12_FULL_43_24]